MSSAHTLSQAEFFRHLELQSVHTVRRMTFYRQALKERLRNTTKQDSLSLPKAKAESTPAVTKAKVTSTNNNNVRRICAKPKVRKEKSSRKLENGFDERRLAALRPIWKVRRGQPKIRKEMEEWVAAKEQSGSKSMIECRIGKSPVENITADRKDSYTCRVRIQKGISKKDIEEEKRNRKTVLPGTFPLLPIEDVSFKPRNVDDDEMESGEKQKMPNTSETDKEKTECTNTKRVETPLPQFSCKKCPKKLSDLQSLSDHDKSVHCRTCRMCQRGISSQGFWFGCPDLCRNCATTITKSKLNCGNKILLMKSPDRTSTSSSSSPLSVFNRQFSKSMNRCDVCSKVFVKRNKMIRHVMSQHASILHKVDLVKFVNRNMIRQKANYVGLDVLS